MEILQTIWTALSTENEGLTNIFTYSLTFLEVFLTMLLFTTLLNIQANSKSKLIYVITFSFFSLFTLIFVPKPYNSFVNVLACPIFVKLIFKTTFFKAILAELIPYIIYVLTGSMTLKLCILLFDISTDMIIKVPIYKICSALLAYFCVYLIYFILKFFNLNISLLDSLKRNTNKILMVNFFIGILAVSVQSYIASLYSEILPLSITILNISTLLFYFIFSLYSLIRTNKLEITERDLEQSKQYIKTLTILHDNIRCFRHDLSNIVTTIGRLCPN